ncbi:tyrosine-type recombinase/integrase [Alkanindiges illinoisensis]|uniref:tyrosine-type recombinase/integrase n=1 Tax=Alkanindiges illinoisensis TaxID=197183 RepID=UPI00047DD4EB|nr:integrase arm-type DNA-binding domain-containing protein [Alkanindiges illinoisensis]
MLTDAKIRNLKPKDKMYRLLDADRLYIEVKPNGSKLWRYKFVLDEKESSMSLGEYPLIGLSRARELHAEMRKLVAEGINPVKHRRDEKLKKQNEGKNTFKVIAEEWIATKLQHKSKRYRDGIIVSLNKDIYPAIGDKIARDVSSHDVLVIIKNTIKRVTSQRNYGTGETTAINNRQIIGGVMRYAIATLRADNDPTYAVRDIVEKPPINHARPLDKTEIRELKNKLIAYGGTQTVKNAVNLLFYTMLRTIEIRRARWEHVDFENQTLTLPMASREQLKDGKRLMKKNRTHIVPLSTQALKILEAQRKISGMTEYIFPSPYNPEKMLSPATINRVFQNIELSDVTAHDFRATASTTLNEIEFNEDWIEIQLAHVSSNQTRASYNHAKYLSKRAGMMQWWADWLDGSVTDNG